MANDTNIFTEGAARAVVAGFKLANLIVGDDSSGALGVKLALGLVISAPFAFPLAMLGTLWDKRKGNR